MKVKDLVRMLQDTMESHDNAAEAEVYSREVNPERLVNTIQYHETVMGENDTDLGPQPITLDPAVVVLV